MLEDALKAAQSLVNDAEFNADDKARLKLAIVDLARGGLTAQVAGTRFQELVKKAGPDRGSAIKQVLASVLSEPAKKAADI